jgi:hypothetical protein
MKEQFSIGSRLLLEYAASLAAHQRKFVNEQQKTK